MYLNINEFIIFFMVFALLFAVVFCVYRYKYYKELNKERLIREPYANYFFCGDNIASNSEAIAGNDTLKVLTPSRIKEMILKEGEMINRSIISKKPRIPVDIAIAFPEKVKQLVVEGKSIYLCFYNDRWLCLIFGYKAAFGDSRASAFYNAVSKKSSSI